MAGSFAGFLGDPSSPHLHIFFFETSFAFPLQNVMLHRLHVAPHQSKEKNSSTKESLR